MHIAINREVYLPFIFTLLTAEVQIAITGVAAISGT
jgi:hypothetical protein